MADHFLDTETRHHIPHTAWMCAKAGLSVEEARRIWREEVSPVVGFNLWLVAGEWAGWDTEWLVSQIEKRRQARGLRRWLQLRSGGLMMGGVWRSIATCLELLRQSPEPEALFQDLAFLARHYFDFVPQPLDSVEEARRARIQALYPAPFLEALSPALVPGEANDAEARVRSALATSRDRRA